MLSLEVPSRHIDPLGHSYTLVTGLLPILSSDPTPIDGHNSPAGQNIQSLDFPISLNKL